MPDEYISREAALTALQDSDLFNTTERQLRAIRELPAADVAEVARCKDCKHKVRTDANGIVICSEEHGMYCPTENDFCRYGVKKGETPE